MKIFEENGKIRLQLKKTDELGPQMIFDFTVTKEEFKDLRVHMMDYLMSRDFESTEEWQDVFISFEPLTGFIIFSKDSGTLKTVMNKTDVSWILFIIGEFAKVQNMLKGIYNRELTVIDASFKTFISELDTKFSMKIGIEEQFIRYFTSFLQEQRKENKEDDTRTDNTEV